MKFVHLLLFLGLICSNINAQEEAGKPEILGFAYNLFAVKAQKLEQSKPFGECKVPGGILLDPRKSYSSTFEKDEYFSDDVRILKENEVFQLPGYFRMTTIYRTDIKDYVIASKLANQWSNHTYEEILENEHVNQGAEIACTNCNFRKTYYNDQANCSVSVFYQIIPLRDREELAFQESITAQNKGMERMELIVEELKPKKARKTYTMKETFKVPKTSEVYTKHAANANDKSEFDKKILANIQALK